MAHKRLDTLSLPAIGVGGVTLYRMTPQTLAPYRKLTALEMERRAARTRFEALLLAAKTYLDGGGDPESLSPERAQQLGLLPQGWFGGAFLASGASNPIFHSAVMLGPAGRNGIAVGIEGWYDALEPLIRSYGVDATRIYFPYPAPLMVGSNTHGPAMLVMTFDRPDLARATQLNRLGSEQPRKETGGAPGTYSARTRSTHSPIPVQADSCYLDARGRHF